MTLKTVMTSLPYMSNQVLPYESVDGGKNPSQQRETLPVLQVPIRLTNVLVWQARWDYGPITV